MLSSSEENSFALDGVFFPPHGGTGDGASDFLRFAECPIDFEARRTKLSIGLIGDHATGLVELSRTVTRALELHSERFGEDLLAAGGGPAGMSVGAGAPAEGPDPFADPFAGGGPRGAASRNKNVFTTRKRTLTVEQRFFGLHCVPPKPAPALARDGANSSDEARPPSDGVLSSEQPNLSIRHHCKAFCDLVPGDPVCSIDVELGNNNTIQHAYDALAVADPIRTHLFPLFLDPESRDEVAGTSHPLAVAMVAEILENRFRPPPPGGEEELATADDGGIPTEEVLSSGTHNLPIAPDLWVCSHPASLCFLLAVHILSRQRKFGHYTKLLRMVDLAWKYVGNDVTTPVCGKETSRAEVVYPEEGGTTNKCQRGAGRGTTRRVVSR